MGPRAPGPLAQTVQKIACCSPKGCNCSLDEANGGNNAAPRQVSLCTGTLGQALGVAYDWFYTAMTSEQRKAVRRALVTQVLNVFAEGLSAGFVGSIWWRTKGNFNGCIDGGALIAALAVLDEPGSATPGSGAIGGGGLDGGCVALWF